MNRKRINKRVFCLFVSVSLLFACSGNTAVANQPENLIFTQEDSLITNSLPNVTIEQSVMIPALPKEASFADEPVPLEFFDVYESLEREMITICYWHSSLTYIVQLSGRYQKMIEDILIEEGLHKDFFYLCVAESMLQPSSSPANAQGYWQFLEGTAKDFGLEVSEQVDERYNWEKSTRAAAKYFKKAYEKYGTWTLAAASYNIGMANINNRIAYQSINNYYDMQLPPETARYVYRAIAFKIIMNNLSDYGFKIAGEHKYKPLECNKVNVSTPVANWSEFAAAHGTNFKMLKMMNEWIRSNKLDNKLRKTYTVLVPDSNFRNRK